MSDQFDKVIELQRREVAPQFRTVR
jgi:hypothetical protein